MKRKRLALLLAIAMTVTSLDSTAMVASGADFSSEPIVEEEVSTQAEEESQPVAEEEENIEFSDSDEAEIDFSADEATDESAVQETPDEVEVQEEENSNEEAFSDSNEVSVETTDETEAFSEESSIVPADEDILHLQVDGTFNVEITEENKEFWYDFTPEETGTYVISSISEGLDPKVSLFDKRDVTDIDTESIDSNDDANDAAEGNNAYDFRLAHTLQAGTTYYFCIRNINSQLGNLQINFKKQPVINNISVSLSQDSPVAGFDNFASVLSNCEMTVTYTDGTEKLYNANNWAGYTTIDSYGNSISPVWKRNGEIIDIDEPNAYEEYFAESVYTLQYVTGSEEDNTLFYSNEVTVNPVSPENLDRYMGELSEGENTELNHYGSEDVFKFVPTSSGTWSFIYDDYNYRGMTFKKKNEDGSYTTFEQSSPVCDLEEGVTYYFVFYVWDESIKVTKLEGSTSVSANMDNVKKDFIYGLDYVFLSGAELTIKYNDGESETVTFGNAMKLYDSRGNLYSYRFYNADVSGESQRQEYDPGSAPLETGTFKLYFTQNGQKLDGEYEITISKPELSSFPELSEGLNENISSPKKEYAWYTFTPAKTTKYRFWPVNSVRVYEVNGDNINHINSEDSDCVFSLKAKYTYYIGFSGNVYINAQDRYENTMDLQISDVSLTGISFTSDEITGRIGVDDLSVYGRVPEGELKMTFADGSESSIKPVLGESTSVDYGYEIETQIRDTQDAEGKLFTFTDENENEISIPEGTYTLKFVVKAQNVDDENADEGNTDEGNTDKVNVIESNEVTFTVKSPSAEDFPQLVLGRNEDVQIGSYDYDTYDGADMVWYALQVENAGVYQMKFLQKNNTFFDETVIANWKKLEDGKLQDVEIEKASSYSYYLNEGTYLVRWYAKWVDDPSIVNVDISKISVVEKVELQSWAPKTLEFIAGIESPDLDGLKVRVTYDNGDTREFDLKDNMDDNDRCLNYDIYRRGEDGEYQEVAQDEMTEGYYYFRVSFGGKFADEVIPLTLKSMENSKNADLNHEVFATDAENQGKFLLKYHANEAGRYEFRFNIPLSDAELYMANGDIVRDTSIDKYSCYANLQESTTYYLYVHTDKYCKEMQVSVSRLTRPTSLKANARKTNYIAGIDPFNAIDMETEITYSDETSRTARGCDSVNGYNINYKVEKGDDSVAEGNTLFAGTWTVTPYLSVSVGSGSAIAKDTEDISVESTEITADFLDQNKLTTLKEGEWIPLQNTAGNRKFYLFTPNESGMYVCDRQDKYVNASIGFYNKGEKQYEILGWDEANLEKGKTYLACVVTSDEVQMMISHNTSTTDPDESQKAEVTNNIELSDGMKKLVSIGTTEFRHDVETRHCIKATFTPESTGYYQIKTSKWKDYVDTCVKLYDSDYEEIAENDDGGENNNCLLTVQLEAGQNYTYEIYTYGDEETIPFFLHFNKTEMYSVSDMKLVPKEGVNTEEASVVDPLAKYYQLQVTYKKKSGDNETANDTDTKTEVYELPDNGELFTDKYGNHFKSRYTEETKLEEDFEYSLNVMAYDAMEDMDDDEAGNPYVLTASVKGLNTLTEFEPGKNYPIPVKASQWYRFTPSEDGEYICKYKEANPQTVGILVAEPKTYNGNLYTEDCYENVEGSNTFSVQLKKGKTYVIAANGWYNDENDSFCIRKAEKELNGLEFVSGPDQYTIMPFETDFVSLKGLTVSASYTDGTTEDITYGNTDSSGRSIQLESIKWMDGMTCCVYVTLGKYRTSFELGVGTWDDLESIKTSETKTWTDAIVGDVLTLKYTPEATGLYKISVDGGFVVYEILTEDTENIQCWTGSCYLEKDRNYYIRIKTEARNGQVSINAGGCVWVTVHQTDPTCTDDGQLVEKCKTHQDEAEKVTVLPALGHDWSDWEETPATCTEDGKKERHCKRKGCEGKETEVIKATGHNWSEWTVEKAATCTEDGSEVRSCSNCKEKQTRVIDKLGHDLGEWKVVTEAKCEVAGEEQRSCSRCDYKETKEIPALKHNWSNWTVEKAATCTEAGSKERSCSNCGEKETEVIKALGHDWSDLEETPATCTENGKKERHCKRDGCEEKETEVIKATGHNWSTWEGTSATCTEAGSKERTCSNCGEKETEVTKALGHDWSEWKETPVTCTEDGKKERYCKRDGCEERETEVTKALGHIWSEWKVTPATCEQDGFQTRLCVRCNKQEREILPATGHAWGETQTIESTDTENGKEYQICETCKAENVTKVLPKKATAKTIEQTQKTLTEIENSQNETEKAEKITSVVNDLTNVENQELAKDDSAMVTISQVEEKVIENTSVAATVVENENTAGVTVDQNVKGAALTAAVNKDKADETVKEIAAKISVNDVSEENQNSYKEQYGENAIAVDITMSVVDADTKNAISEETTDIQPAAPIQMKMTLPEQYADQKVELLHNHEGVVESLPFTREGLTLTFTMTALSDVIVQPVCETHQFDEGKVTTEATCTSLGVLTKTCTICKKKETESIQTAKHNYQKNEAASKEATCTEDGVVVNTCSICKETNNTVISALQHKWSEWKETKPATCTENGEQERYCERDGCEGKETNAILATGHKWNEWKETPATCTEAGSKERSCSTCNEKDEQILPVLGHDLTDWKVTKAATCAKNGEKERHCTRTGCKEKQTQVIKATGKHSMGAWKVTKAATAVAAGVKERTCKVCGGAKERASIAKLKATLTLNVPVNRTLPMKMRQTFQAKASGLAKGDKVVSWTSSNRRVATVSGNGRIAAQRIAGNAVITVKLASGKTAKFTVKVQRTDVATTAVTVTNKATRRRLTGTVNLKLRKNLALGVSLTPLTSTQRVTYSTSNSRIASVNSRGVVTARRTGTVTITVRSGRKIARIRVRVTR